MDGLIPVQSFEFEKGLTAYLILSEIVVGQPFQDLGATPMQDVPCRPVQVKTLQMLHVRESEVHIREWFCSFCF